MRRTALVAILTAAITATTASPTGTAAAQPPTPREYAKRLSEGLWKAAEWPCLRELWHRESRWNPKADNPKSSAYGIPQILGLEERLSPYQQIDRGITYILHRHDTPCQALRHHDRRGWY